MAVEIFHNPRCSKSRQTLQLLEDKGVKPQVRLYLEDNPTKQEVQDILKKLSLSPRDVLRKGEDEYKQNNLSDKTLSDEAIINAIVKFPKLLERPIVINGNKAALGRPPENVLNIL